MGMQSAGRKAAVAHRIRVSGIDLEWHPEQGICTFEKLPVAMMWVDTTLAGLMSGVQAMVGTARFLLALQSEGRKSVEADWQVISSLPDFPQGFEAIANIAAVAGWGDWELTALDAERQEGRFRVKDSWEGGYQKALGVCWGSGMLAGKMAGYCSKLFGTNCWADQTAFIARGDPHDEFVVRPSSRTVEKEIEGLLASDEATRADMEVALRRLEQEIAERWRAEEALREREALFRSQFEYGNIGIAITSVEKRWLRANARLCRMLGYREEELRQLTWAEVTYPEDLPLDLAQFDRMLAGEIEAYEMDKRFLRKDGSVIHTHLTVSCFREPDRSVRFVIASLLDFTERKQAEAALQQSEEKYRVLVENAEEAIFVAQEGMLRFVNRKTTELTGYTREELTSCPFGECIHPDDRAMVLDRQAQRQPGVGLPTTYVFRIIQKSGNTRWVHLNVVWIEWEGRLASLNFMTDVTDRKQAEAALKRSQTLFASIFRASPAATILSTLDEGLCVDANEAYCRLTGFAREELVGRTTTELNIWVSPEERKRVVTELGRHKRLSDVEITIRTKGGALRKTVAAGEVLTIEGQPYILSFFYDITERKRAEVQRFELERQLLHTQKLESLGILAGGIAHDFNNLLMAILGNLDLALLNSSQISPARVNIEHAVQATRRATDLTRQLLAYSGKGHFVVTRIDLNELVRESANLFRTAIAKTVTMQLELSPEPSTTEADPGQVQQVIINLITNASEAIGDQAGTITLTTGSRACDETYLSQSRLSEKPLPGRFAYLEVSDTGSGMDGETLQRIFDPFFTTKFMGRGLGMSAVLGIVRGHKGAILVDSIIGHGTTIRVLFPASAAEPGREAVASSASHQVADLPTPTGTVLVVDDEESVRTLAVAFVHRLGFRAISAADGEEALLLFERHAAEISCVLLDLTMPRMDGLSTFRQMRRLRPDVKVILCSGYGEQEATQRFTSEGLAGFIQKPYILRDLRGMIQQTLKGSH